MSIRNIGYMSVIDPLDTTPCLSVTTARNTSFRRRSLQNLDLQTLIRYAKTVREMYHLYSEIQQVFQDEYEDRDYEQEYISFQEHIYTALEEMNNPL